jgi:hypothetical protein
VNTADGLYAIATTIRCKGTAAIPGYGGALRFPPPPPAAGGGIGSGSSYYYYAFVSTAQEATNGAIGRTEALYRVVY